MVYLKFWIAAFGMTNASHGHRALSLPWIWVLTSALFVAGMQPVLRSWNMDPDALDRLHQHSTVR